MRIIPLCGFAFFLLGVPYGLWWINSHESGFRASLPMTTVVWLAYSEWEDKNCSSRHKDCDPDLPKLIMQSTPSSRVEYFTQHNRPLENAIPSLLVSSNIRRGCPFEWVPFMNCMAIDVRKKIFDNPTVQRIFEQAIENPCKYFTRFDPDKMSDGNGIGRAYFAFECHRSHEGNPYDISVSLYHSDKNPYEPVFHKLYKSTRPEGPITLYSIFLYGQTDN